MNDYKVLCANCDVIAISALLSAMLVVSVLYKNLHIVFVSKFDPSNLCKFLIQDA